MSIETGVIADKADSYGRAAVQVMAPFSSNSKEVRTTSPNTTLRGFRFENTMENTTSSSEALKNFTTIDSIWVMESQAYSNYSTDFYYSYLRLENESNLYWNMSSTMSSVSKKVVTCQWEPAQHSLFQLSNMCFLSACVMPKNYKSGLLAFRILLCLSFVVSAIWAGVHFCAIDWFIWSSGLAITNGVHVIILTLKFLPPALSLELTELYVRLFKPLKMRKKHFKELTKEACLLRLAPGELYAVEEVSVADERLSILLKGRLKVSCYGTPLHSISSYQFVDSPEFWANSVASGARFQVTIIAEEESLCMTWCRIKLDRILRHRPQVKFILNNMIGKDITQKMYSLNEQLGQMSSSEALSRAVRNDHWRCSMNRSVSVDAVDTNTRGHVCSKVWKQTEKRRKSSILSEYELALDQHQQADWYPLITNQHPSEHAALTTADDDSNVFQDDEQEPMLKRTNEEDRRKRQLDTFLSGATLQQHLPFLAPYSKLETIPLLNVASNQILGPQSLALIPVIVPVVATAQAMGTPAATTSSHVTTSAAATTTAIPATSSRAASLKRQREVKFNETQL